MTSVDMMERVLDGMNSHDKRINDHCVRISALETEHKLSEKRHTNTITYVLSGIVVVQFGIMIFKEFM